MELRVLQDEADEVIFATYREAFADYEFPAITELEAFRDFLRRRGTLLSRSVGAWHGERLVGFQLTALGEFGYEATPTAYDVMTGVVPEHRGQGLAGRLFERVLGLLQPGEAQQFLLECLRSNLAAQTAYAKQGFRRTRGFECLELEVGRVELDPPAANVALRELEVPDWVRLTDLHTWHPSWQNSASCLRRASPPPRFVGALRDGALVGYAAVFEASGDLARFAVHPDHHNQGVGAALLAACARRLADGVKVFRILNVPEDAEADLRFFRGRHATTFTRQDELCRPL